MYETSAAGESRAQALRKRYSAQNDQISRHQQVYSILQNRPEAEANEIFQRIRQGADVESIVRFVQDGDLLMQLAVEPESRYRFEFPISPHMPSALQRRDNPYLDSKIYDWAVSRTTDIHESVYLKPYLAAEIVDPRLNAVQPSEWTAVCTDDGLMRKLLGAFFLNEYAWLGSVFQKDYFLDGMISKRHFYCSPLLVNSVLAYACVSTPRLD